MSENDSGKSGRSTKEFLGWVALTLFIFFAGLSFSVGPYGVDGRAQDAPSKSNAG